jgi:hypothetical protein
MATVPQSSTDASAARNTGKVFPLHLAPIDAFFQMDDRPGYPMVSVIRLDFTGEMDRDSLLKGLAVALDRHPLLAAHVRPGKREMPCWFPADDPLPPIDWADWETPVEIARDPTTSATHKSRVIDGGFDLSRETGLRLWVRVGQDRTCLLLQVHHACTDGTGVYRFLGDLLAAYASAVSPELGPPEFTPLTPALLKKRRVKMADVAVHEPSRRFIVHGLQQAWRMFGKRVVPLIPPRSVPPRTDGCWGDFPGIHTLRFTKDEHKQLREAAGRHGAMLNDLLLAEMFRAIRIWNYRQTGKHRPGWLRIMMPYDMREIEDFQMPAANMTAYTFLTRRSHTCDNLQSLVRDIRDETAKIKSGRLGSAFIDAIMLAEFAPWVLNFLLGRGRCIASTILSNIGDPSKRFTAKLARKAGKVVAGNLTLEDVTGVPPLRPGSHATLAIFSYGRELAISIRCNPAVFDAESSQAFLELYVSQLRTHLGETSPERIAPGDTSSDTADSQ